MNQTTTSPMSLLSIHFRTQIPFGGSSNFIAFFILFNESYCVCFARIIAIIFSLSRYYYIVRSYSMFPRCMCFLRLYMSICWYVGLWNYPISVEREGLVRALSSFALSPICCSFSSRPNLSLFILNSKIPMFH